MTEEPIQDVAPAEADPALPTGRCIIDAGGMTSCTFGMTQPFCYQVAAIIGGHADWTRGVRH